MKKILYLGSDPTHFSGEGEVVHYPVIQIAPRDPNDPEILRAFRDLEEYTHLLFTSKNGVKVCMQHLKQLGYEKTILENKKYIAIGKVTAQHLASEGFAPFLVAEEETQEGLVSALRLCDDLDEAYFFIPRSSLSRPILLPFLLEREVRHQVCDLYDIRYQKPTPVPDLEEFDEIIFTSPSTVEGFLQIFPALPLHKQITAIGKITSHALQKIS